MKIPLLLLAALLAPPSRAAEIFVDPVLGADGPGRGGSSHPCRSIASALTLVRPGDTVVVAVGTCDARSGELFPLVVPPGVSLRGAGMRDTFLVGGDPWAPAIRVRLAGGAGPGMSLSGLTVLGGWAGLEAQVEGGGEAPALTLTEVALEDGGHGLALVEAPAAAGIQAAMTLDRCVVAGTWNSGLFLATGRTTLAIRLVNTALIDCGGDALLARGSLEGTGRVSCLLFHATVARAGGAGVRVLPAGNFGKAHALLANSVVWGCRAGDLVNVDPGGIQSSLLGGGPAVGRNGNAAGDPLLLPGRDWHLGPGSPAVGLAARNLTGLPAVDLDGQTRPAVGNLDAGADQQVLHTLLADPRGLRIFRPFTFRLLTLPGADAALLVSLGTRTPGYTLPPLTGALELDYLLALEVVAGSRAGADGVAIFSREVFADTAFLGWRAPFQAVAVRIDTQGLAGGWSNLVQPGLVLP